MQETASDLRRLQCNKQEMVKRKRQGNQKIPYDS